MHHGLLSVQCLDAVEFAKLSKYPSVNLQEKSPHFGTATSLATQHLCMSFFLYAYICPVYTSVTSKHLPQDGLRVYINTSRGMQSMNWQKAKTLFTSAFRPEIMLF